MSTILVAENDPHLLKALVDLISDYGYEVLAADSPIKAREIFANNKIDLLLTDLRLRDDSDDKDISGYILAKEISQTVPVILQSSQLPSHLQSNQNLYLRSKAAGIKQLIEAINSLLDNTE